MKKLFVLAVTGLAFLASCSKDGNGTKEPASEGSSAALQIEFDNEGYTPTRAVDDRELKDATIFAIDKNGRIVKKFYEANMPARVITKEYKVTTAVKKVVIIGNAGDLTSVTGYMSDLEAITRKISEMSDMSTKGIWMTGMTETALDFAASTDYATTPGFEDLKLVKCHITMHLIPAKVTVIAENHLGTEAKKTLTIKEVAFLYSGQFTHLLPQRTKAAKYNDIYAPTFATVAAMAGPPTYYASGYANWRESGTGGTVYTPFVKTWDGSATLNHTFYVLPGIVGTTDSKDAILTIKAERTLKDNSKEDEYFSIFFNEKTRHVKEFLSSGKHYTITLKLMEDPSGPEWPDIENEAMISVTVAIDNWIAVAITKEFE